MLASKHAIWCSELTATEQVTSLAKPNALVQIQIIETTTMAAYFEMMSFIDKFNQMASFGFQANLNFNPIPRGLWYNLFHAGGHICPPYDF